MIRLEHVGIAVGSLEESLPVWETLGAHLESRETVASQGVNVAFLNTGAAHTELLEAIDDDSPIAKFLKSGKRGVHHLAYRVDGLDDILAALKERGVPLIHEQPVPGSRGTRIAFIHPKGTGGVLVELVESVAGEHGDSTEETESSEA